ncbi:hypothetical protein [Haladaptatus sp. NG-WS-4]
MMHEYQEDPDSNVTAVHPYDGVADGQRLDYAGSDAEGNAVVTVEAKYINDYDLGPADKMLLDLLRKGRVTAPYAADETGYSLQYVRDRLGRLVEHGNAQKVYEGLYELVEDPRKNE